MDSLKRLKWEKNKIFCYVIFTSSVSPLKESQVQENNLKIPSVLRQFSAETYMVNNTICNSDSNKDVPVYIANFTRPCSCVS